MTWNNLIKSTGIVLTMIGVSNSNKTSYWNGCQSRTNAYILLQMECYIGINIGWHCLLLLFLALLNMRLVQLSQHCSVVASIFTFKYSHQCCSWKTETEKLWKLLHSKETAKEYLQYSHQCCSWKTETDKIVKFVQWKVKYFQQIHLNKTKLKAYNE